jgi:hypothetical protein
LSDGQIVSAYETGSGGAVVRRRDVDAEPPRWATVGFDQAGREVELVFVKLMESAVLVFHANWATKEFKKEIGRSYRG